MEILHHNFENLRRDPITVVCLAASLVLTSCSEVGVKRQPLGAITQEVDPNDTLQEFPDHRETAKSMLPTPTAIPLATPTQRHETIVPISVPTKSRATPTPSARPLPRAKVSPSPKSAPVTRPTPSVRPPAPKPAEAPRSSDGPENYKTFSPQGFVKLWWDIQPRPNTVWLAQPPSIYGNQNIDKHIRSVAEGRGYRKNPVNTRGATEISNRFETMRSAAAASGVRFKFTSGFRSPDKQRQIFTGKFNAQCQARYGRNCRESEITSGKVNDLLHKVLKLSSIPGYSSHHTGWVVDIGDNNGPFIKQGSAAFKWLSENNYWRAKKYGFGPRYPIGASSQGPDPEVWEFYYAGRQHFKK